MVEIVLLFAAVVLFLAGFYTGLWVQRHSYVDREVPKIIETQRVIEKEKPVVIQVPRPAPANGGSLPIMGSGANKNVLTPQQQSEAQHMQELLGGMPEI